MPPSRPPPAPSPSDEDLVARIDALAEAAFREGSLAGVSAAVARGERMVVPRGHRVTVRHLLTHTSGIKNYTDLPAFLELAAVDTPPEDIVRLFADEPFGFVPGERWEYSNSNYFLLGLIIEQVTGESYASHVAERIVRPLGLRHTSYCPNEPAGEDQAQGYTLSGGKLVDDQPINMQHPYPAGALCSTVEDLVRWTPDLLTQRDECPGRGGAALRLLSVLCVISCRGRAWFAEPGLRRLGDAVGRGFPSDVEETCCRAQRPRS
ncbi:MAG: serine hydrolase domain-containing protein [Egibacteraceae bacterium]